MKLPQITIKNMAATQNIKEMLEKRIQRLEHFFPRILGCRVLVESPHYHKRNGEHFRVRIELAVPGKEIVVNRDPSEKESHADLYVSIRDAFRAATRQLQDYSREIRGDVKHHERLSLQQLRDQENRLEGT